MGSGPAVKCAKCADIIKSSHVHEMVKCKCGAIAIDGGDGYTRCMGSFEDFIWDFDDKTQ